MRSAINGANEGVIRIHDQLRNVTDIGVLPVARAVAQWVGVAFRNGDKVPKLA